MMKRDYRKRKRKMVLLKSKLLNKLFKIIIRMIEYQLCLICNKQISGPNDYKNHMESRKHKRKAKVEIKREINECGSFKNYLKKKEFLTKRKNNLNRIRYYLYINSMKNILN